MSDTFNIKTKKESKALSLLLFLAVTVFSMNLSLVLDPALILLFLAISITASVLLSVIASPAMSVIAGITGFALSLLVTKSPVIAALSVIHLPFAMWLGPLFKNKLSRSAAVGGASFSVTVIVTALLLYQTYNVTKTVSIDAILFTFKGFFDAVSEILYTSFYVEIVGNEVPLIAPSNVRSYLNFIIGIIPSVIAAMSAFIGFIVSFICKKALDGLGLFTAVRSKWRLLSSPVTVIFFALTYVFSLIFTETSFLTLAVLNLEIIFFTFIFVSGLFSAFEPIYTNGIPRPRILRPFLLIIAIFNNTSYFATLCVIFGIYDSIREAVTSKKLKNQE